MAKILAPNKEFNNISATVQFIKGVGETSNPHLIEWFRSKGYEVVEENEPVKPEPTKNVPVNTEPVETELKPEDPVKAEPVKNEDPVKQPDLPNFNTMDVGELIDYALDNGIDIGKATSRNGILKKILDAKEKN